MKQIRNVREGPAGVLELDLVRYQATTGPCFLALAPADSNTQHSRNLDLYWVVLCSPHAEDLRLEGTWECSCFGSPEITGYAHSGKFHCSDFSSLQGEQRDTEGAVALLHCKLILVQLVIVSSGMSLMFICINPNAGKGLEKVQSPMFCFSLPVWHRIWKFRKSAQHGQIALVREDKELDQLRGLADAVGLSNACYAVSTLPTRAEIESLPVFPRDKLNLHNLLGSGAFGEVYEGTAVDITGAGNGEYKVAVKTLKKGATDYEKSEFLKEAHLMSKFDHPHILKLLGVCLLNEPQYIILELMEGGDLLSYLRGAREQKFRGPLLKVADLLSICLDICKGCVYLEKMHFIHRDLAARNCLVSVKEYTNLSRIVKIGDFGLARDVYKNDYYRKRGEGLLPVRWMAPESLIDGVFTNRSDVWAFGVLIWESLTLGHQPYPGYSNLDVLHHVQSGGRLELPNNCPDDLWDLMTKCWAQEPHNRPTFCYMQEQLQELRNSPMCCTPQLEDRMLSTGLLNHAFEDTDGDAPCTDSESTLSAALMETRNIEGLNYLVLVTESNQDQDKEKTPCANEEISKGKYPVLCHTFSSSEGVNYASDNDE
uniref:Tyrosine-protein kinase receptor n=1 Tax=Gopherus evgoodei TaxID=1825980 RepID=A0A8C4YF70_9SAUR